MLTYGADLTTATRGGTTANVYWQFILYYNAEGAGDALVFVEKAHGEGASIGAQVAHHCLLSVSPIVSSLDPHDCTYAVSSVTCKIAETDLWPNAAAKTTTTALLDLTNKEYRNRKVTLSFIVSDKIVSSAMCTPFVGRVRDYWFDSAERCWYFELIGKDEKLHKTLPADKIDLTTYPYADESVLGLPQPLVYGTFWMSNTSNYGYEYYLGVSRRAPCYCVDKRTGLFLIASHACHTLEDTIDLYDDGLNEFIVSLRSLNRGGSTTSPFPSHSGPTTVTLPIDGTTSAETQCWQGSVYLIPTIGGAFNDIADVGNLIDRDFATELTVGSGTRVTLKFAGLTSSITHPLVAPSTSPEIITYVTSVSGDCWSTFLNPLYAGTTTQWFSDAIPDTGLEGDDFGNPGASIRSDTAGVAKGSTDQWTWEELASYEYGFEADSGSDLVVKFIAIACSPVYIMGTPPIAPVYRNNARTPERYVPAPGDYGLNPDYFAVRALYPRRKPETWATSASLFVSRLAGRKYGSWISDGGRSLGAGYSTSDYMTQTAYISESIVRDEMGVDTGDIDVTELDANKASYLAANLDVNEFIDSRELLSELGFYGRFIPYCTTDNKWRWRYFKDTFAASDTDFDQTQVSFTRFYWTDPALLCTTAQLNYHWDYARSQYMRTTSVTNVTASGTTADGQNRTAVKTFDTRLFYYNYGNPSLPSDEWAAYYVKQWKDPHLLIDFEVADASMWKVQEGDVVTFQNIPADRNPFGLGTGGATDCMASFDSPRTKYFLITCCERQKTKVLYKAFQLHDLS